MKIREFINAKILQSAITIIIVAFALTTSKEVSSQYELNQYLITAAENNPGLKSNFYAYMAEMEKIPQVGGYPDLKFAFGYFIQPVETRVGPQRAKLSMEQKFPWFGMLNSREDVASARAQSFYQIFKESKSKLYYEVKSAYYDLYFIEKSIGISVENIEILNTLLQLSLTNIESGSSSIVDEYRIEMEINDLENKLALLRDTKHEYTIRFNRLLNISEKTSITIPDSLWQAGLTLSKETLIDSIQINNHEIKEIDTRITTWEKKTHSAQKTYNPQVLLGLDYTFVDKYENSNLSLSENGRDAMLVKVGVTIPLYGKKYNALIRETELQVKKEGFSKNEKLNRLNVVFEKVFKEYNDSLRRLKLFEKQYNLASRSLNVMMDRYATDGRNFIEVLRMQKKMLSYDLKLDKARTDINASVAFVDYLMGK